MILATMLLSSAPSLAVAQSCAANYFQKLYVSPDKSSPLATAVNARGEIIMAGAQNAEFSSKSQGWMAKLTGQGTLIWSKVLTVPGYDNIIFNGAVAMPDGGFMLSGNILTLDNATQALRRGWGFVVRVDTYGNIIWTKGFSNYFEESNVTFLRTVIKTGDDDFILFGDLLGHKPPFLVRGSQEIMRINGDGVVKWRTSVNSDVGYVLDADKIGFALTSNGSQLVLGMEMDKRELVGLGYGLFYEQGYTLLNLDYNSGANNWNHSYTFPLIVTLNGTARSGTRHISVLPDGGYAFGFSFAENDPLSGSPATKRAALMITDAGGNMKKVIGYTGDQPGLFLADAQGTGTPGEQVMLFGDGRKDILAAVDANGALVWQRAYRPAVQRSFPLGLHPAGTGFQLINSLDDGGAELVKTEALGKMDCTEITPTIVTSDITSLFTPAAPDFRFLSAKETLPPLNGSVTNGRWTESTLCIETCCRDTIDLGHSKELQLCSGTTLTLPDNTVVKDTGSYYVAYKTAKGCDSIIYYHVVGVPDPSTLRITGPQCLNGSDPIKLSATPGFPAYVWQPSGSTGPELTVTTTGLYSVSVNTSCGTNTDTRQVYADCPNTVLMPNAFTPNGDGLNDVFRIPPSNFLELKVLRVYDRYGKMVFETKDASKGWDGTFNGVKQSAGTFVYHVEMKGPDGRDIKSTGTVTLIR